MLQPHQTGGMTLEQVLGFVGKPPEGVVAASDAVDGGATSVAAMEISANVIETTKRRLENRKRKSYEGAGVWCC